MTCAYAIRGFDQQCAEKICDYMQETGTKFIRGAIPDAMEKAASGVRLHTSTHMLTHTSPHLQAHALPLPSSLCKLAVLP